MTIRFDVLGALQIRHDNVLLPMAGLKNRTVISCLALHPEEPIPVEALLKAAWDDPPPSAVHQVRKMISSLRSSVYDGYDLVSTSQNGYLLNVTPEHSDLAQFTRLWAQAMSSSLEDEADLARAHAALALWRGRPCEGSEPRGCERRMEELLDQHRALLGKTVRAFARHGREEELVAVLQVAARIHGDGAAYEGAGRDGSPARPAAAEPAAPAAAATRREPPAELGVGRRCLPRDLRDFSGRTAEMGRLTQFLASGRPGPLVATVHGMGGVGKTALAVHVAHRTARHFPDGQLFVAIGESVSPGMNAVRDALGSLLRQLGVQDEDMPSSTDSRLVRWRDLTSDRRLLVVVDDAASAEQVEQLMPTSAHSACVVTSRVVLNAIDGALYVRLEVPSLEECLEMLCNILGAAVVDEDEAAATALVRMFDHLPLALRLASARLLTHEFLSLRELVRSLDDSESPADDLDLPGRSVLGQLNTSLIRMEQFDLDRYLKLSLLPAPELDEAAVSAATGMTTDQARRTCRRFTDRALLERVGTGAYRMHPLLARAAQTHVQASMPVEAQRRVVADALQYYKQSIGLIGSARVSPSPGPAAGLLFATLTRSATLASALDLHEAFADLCLAWERPVTLHLDVDQQQVVWGLALEAAARHRDPSARGYILLALSRCLWHRNAVAEGMDLTRRAREEAERAGDDLLRLRSLLRSSSFAWLSRDVPAGLGYLAESKALVDACRRQAGEAEVLRELMEVTSNEAALLAQREDFAAAARLSRQVVDAPDVDPRVRIMAGVTYAASQLGLRRYPEARMAEEDALREADRVRSAYGRALALQQAARTLRVLMRPDAAEAAAEEGRAAAREAGSTRLVEELNAFLPAG